MEKERLFTLTEAAASSGYCTQYLRKLCRDKHVCHTRRGKRYFFTALELEQLIWHVEIEAEHTAADIAEIEKEKAEKENGGKGK